MGTMLLILPDQSRAADAATNISISPLTFDLSANPGDTITNEILVRNSGSSPVVITPEAEDFVADGEDGQITLTESKSTYSLASWIQLDGSQITLNGGQQQRVKFVIRVPFNAEPGGHYASVYAHLSPTNSNATSGSGVGQKIGALVLLKVGGTAKEEASISQFATTKQSYQTGPVGFDLKVQNSGSVHIKPMGVIAITDMFGKKVGTITVDQKNILPGATRHFTAQWTDPPVFGKFNATILALYGADNKQVTASTTFWIIPWKLIGLWGGGIVAVLLCLWLVRRRLRNAFKALLDKQ
jgi:hypothetical protein